MTYQVGDRVKLVEFTNKTDVFQYDDFYNALVNHEAIIISNPRCLFNCSWCRTDKHHYDGSIVGVNIIMMHLNTAYASLCRFKIEPASSQLILALF